MRHQYLVSYDVSDKKRLRRMLKTMRGFGSSVQLSVFLCSLSAREKVLMLGVVDKVINHKDDQVLVINLGPSEGRGLDCIDVLGRPCIPADRQAIII
jgi:CRISPR-associated protein Cas2